MTHEKIAHLTNIHRTNLTDLFNSKRMVGPKVAKRIAAYLGEPDWRKFVHMPGAELKQILLPEKRISNS